MLLMMIGGGVGGKADAVDCAAAAWKVATVICWMPIDVATTAVTITITLWTDSGLRHEVSFAVSTDSAAQ